MKKYLINLMDYIRTHAFILKKAVVFSICLILIFWSIWVMGLKTYMIQHIYGVKDQTDLIVSQTDYFENIPPAQTLSYIKGRGYTVEMHLLKKYQVIGYVAYVDRYHFLGTWYRSNRYAYIYDHVVPLDVAIVHGTSALPQNLKKTVFDHEYRLLWTTYTDPAHVHNWQEINNNHIIPANKTIEKGLSILKQGQIALLEGYLVNLKGVGKDVSFELNSALIPGEISSQKAAGQTTGLCRVIYLTKLQFDGYIYE